MKQKRTYPDPLINLAEVSRLLTGKLNTINAQFIPKEHREEVEKLDKVVKRWKHKQK